VRVFLVARRRDGISGRRIANNTAKGNDDFAFCQYNVLSGKAMFRFYRAAWNADGV